MDMGCVPEQGSNESDVHEGGRSEQGGEWSLQGIQFDTLAGESWEGGQVLSVFACHCKSMPSIL